MNDATRTIVGALVVSGVFITADEIRRGDGLPPLRAYLGLAFAGVMLGFIAEPAPAVAAGFAVLLALGVTLTRGVPVLQSIGGIAK